MHLHLLLIKQIFKLCHILEKSHGVYLIKKFLVDFHLTINVLKGFKKPLLNTSLLALQSTRTFSTLQKKSIINLNH